MCIILYKPAGQKSFLSETELEDCREYNPDGIGIATVKGSKVLVKKALYMSPATVKSFLSQKNRDVVVHYRLGTAGRKDKENCHPFPIGTKQDSMLFHNGILRYYGNMQESDTREFCGTVMSYLPESSFRPLLKALGGSYAIATPSGIITVGDFQFYKGVFCSNLFPFTTRGIEYDYFKETISIDSGKGLSGSSLRESERDKEVSERLAAAEETRLELLRYFNHQDW